MVNVLGEALGTGRVEKLSEQELELVDVNLSASQTKLL